jgi:hypothetical protein
VKFDNAIETIALFFNDLIGALIPGIVLGVGLLIMHVGLSTTLFSVVEQNNGFLVLVLLSLLFAGGHALLALHVFFIAGLLKKSGLIDKDPLKKPKENEIYLLFRQAMGQKIQIVLPSQKTESGGGDLSFNDMRNLAFSLSTEGTSLGHRFMFISLLCNGVATAFLVMLVDYLLCLSFAPHYLAPHELALPAPFQVLLLSILAGLLFKRAEEFYVRAMSTPFAVALSEIINDQQTNANQ